MGTSSAIAPDTVLLGKYRVERTLGEGGMGVVVQARHIELDEVVAIKLLNEGLAVSQEIFARFAREAKAAARLKSSHVVRVSDVGRLPDGMPYMVMEMLEGIDLSQMLKQHGPLSLPYLADLMIQTCEVLAEAHEYGIVHRDIKPSNLFVVTDDDGGSVLKLLDFGIAKAPDATNDHLTQTQSTLGSPAYMSPEQLRSSKSVDHRADLWALGVAMHELLEGSRPFAGETYSELCFKIGLDQPNPFVRVPPPFAEVIQKCLEKDPANRYQSAVDLAVALLPFAGDEQSARQEIDRMRRLRVSAEKLRTDPTPLPTRGRFRGTVEMASGPSAPTQILGTDDHETTPATPRAAASALRPVSSVPIMPSEPRRSRPLLWVLLTFVMLGLGAGAFFLWNAKEPVESAPEPTSNVTPPTTLSTTPTAPTTEPPPTTATTTEPAGSGAGSAIETAVSSAGSGSAVAVVAETHTTDQKPPGRKTATARNTKNRKAPDATTATVTPPPPPPPPTQPQPDPKKKADPKFIDSL